MQRDRSRNMMHTFQPNTPGPRLPAEILDMIIDAVPPHDWQTWAACRLVSRAFNRRGRTNLFRTLVVTEHRVWDGSLLAFLDASPDIKRFVHELVFKLSGWSSSELGHAPHASAKAGGSLRSWSSSLDLECESDTEAEIDVDLDRDSMTESEPSPVCIETDVLAHILDRLPNVHTISMHGVACAPLHESSPSERFWVPSVPYTHRRLRTLHIEGVIEEYDIASTLRFFSKVPVGTLRLGDSPRWPWPDEGDSASHAAYGVPDPVLADQWEVGSVEMAAQADLAAYYASLLSGSVAMVRGANGIRRLALARVMDFGGELLDFVKIASQAVEEMEVNLGDVESKDEVEQLAKQLASCRSLRALRLVVSKAWTREEAQTALWEPLLRKLPKDLHLLHFRLIMHQSAEEEVQVDDPWWPVLNQILLDLQKLQIVYFDGADSQGKEDCVEFKEYALAEADQRRVRAALPTLNRMHQIVFSHPY